MQRSQTRITRHSSLSGSFDPPWRTESSRSDSRQTISRVVNILVFIHTNLIELPDDLDLKWPLGATIHFDTAHFTEIPMCCCG